MYSELFCGVFEPSAPTRRDSYDPGIGSEIMYADWMAMWDGMSVSERRALKISAVYRAVNLISDGVAVIPVELYERDRSVIRGRKQATEHPVSYLLNVEPNIWQTPYELKKTLMCQVLLRGNSYIYVCRDKNGVPNELFLLPENTWPQWEHGDVWYVTDIGTPDRPEYAKVPDSDVIHVRGLSMDGMMGLSVLRLAASTFRKKEQQEEYANAIYKNGAAPSAALHVEKTLSDEAFKRLRTSFYETYTGSKNAGKVAVLEDGTKYVPIPITLSPDDVHFIEQEEFDLLTIANWFGLTPDQLGYPKGSQAYSSLQVMSQRHLDNAINPHLVKIEQAFRQKLLSVQELRRGMFIEFDRSTAIRMNIKEMFEAYSLAGQNSIMSANEIRDKLNLPPRTDKLGDEYMMPLNTAFATQRKELADVQIEKIRSTFSKPAPVNGDRMPDEFPNENKTPNNDMREIVEDYFGRARRYIEGVLRRRSKSAERLHEWRESAWRESLQTVQEILKPLDRAVFTVNGRKFESSAASTQLIEEYRELISCGKIFETNESHEN